VTSTRATSTASPPAVGEQTLPLVVAMHRLLRGLRRSGGPAGGGSVGGPGGGAAGGGPARGGAAGGGASGGGSAGGVGQPVPPTQLIVLALLRERGPLRIGELAARIPCSQPTATTVVAAMAGAGLVRRDPDPADRRAVVVVATDTGLAVLDSVAAAEADRLAALLAELPAADRDAVLAAGPVLARLAERLLS
jgi:DNA-binding MarR family transcriptional regulator